MDTVQDGAIYQVVDIRVLVIIKLIVMKLVEISALVIINVGASSTLRGANTAGYMIIQT
jgi:hypothetical protein